MEKLWEKSGGDFKVGQTSPLTIFLPGWGFTGKVFGLAEKDAPYCFPDFLLDPATFAEDLLSFLNENDVAQVQLVGWSLGGNLAYDFARTHPERVHSLVLIGLRQIWPQAAIDEILAGLDQEVADYMRSFYRKSFLGYKKSYQRFVETMQEDCLRQAGAEILERGLHYLHQFQPDPVPTCPIYSWHGQKDIVAPAAERFTPTGASCRLIEHGGHALFVDKKFLLPEEQRKKKIRRRFSKAAQTYDHHADVQTELVARLENLLDRALKPEKVLELGCGTGNLTLPLRLFYPEAQMTALDFAPDMLLVAQEKLRGQRVDFVCEDGELFLASCRKRFDLICSNGTMQWFGNLPQSLADAATLLRPGGQFIGTIFGPKTMQELGEGLAGLFAGQFRLPTHRFLTHNELTTLLENLFSMVEVEEYQARREYESLADLLDHIRKTGTGGGQEQGVMLNRSRLSSLAAWFEERLGGYPATYQAFIIRCKK